MAKMQVLIDRGWHPLASGFPPEWADGWGEDQYGVFAEVVIGDAGFRLRWIPAGRFTIGSPEDEAGRSEAEGPKTEITFADGFWIMDAPVTQALWEAMGRDNRSRFVSPDRPVERVSWDEARAFCADLTARLSGLTLGLPSEAQWEYACRGDVPDATYAGPMEILGDNNAPVLNDIAWYGGNSGVGFELEDGENSEGWPEKAFEHDRAGTRPVRLKEPNPWGCHDMLGNVWEWCEDIWAEGHPGIDPTGAPRPVSKQETGAARVVRGGSWYNDARGVRAAFRGRYAPEARNYGLGFRCASVQASRASTGGQDDRPSGREAEPRPDAPASAGEDFLAEVDLPVLGEALLEPRGQMVPTASLERGLLRAKSVAAIRKEGQTVGTGFAVSGANFGLAPDQLLLVAASHSFFPDIGTDQFEPREYEIVFDNSEDQSTVLHSLLYFGGVATDAVGVSVFALSDLTTPLPPIPLNTETLPAIQKGTAVYIVGHPHGGEKTVSNGALLDHEGQPGGHPTVKSRLLIQYEVPTQPGSSGSPVFDRDWNCIGVHLARGPQLPRLNGVQGNLAAGQGVWIGSVVEGFRQSVDERS